MSTLLDLVTFLTRFPERTRNVGSSQVSSDLLLKSVPPPCPRPVPLTTAQVQEEYGLETSTCPGTPEFLSCVRLLCEMGAILRPSHVPRWREPVPVGL